MEILLGIDAGTTSIKTGLFTSDGQCLAIDRQEYQLNTPQADRAELDAETYWQACIKSIKNILNQTGVPLNKITALSVSSQGETLIVVDKEGKPIYPAIVWVDNRAVQEADYLKSVLVDKNIYDNTGIPEIIATWTACKILWLKNHEPHIFKNAGKFLLVEDFLIYKLTGKYVTNGSISCTTLYYDIVRDDWWHPILDAININVSNLPEIVLPGEIVETISSSASEQTGLPKYVKVVTGGMDQSIGAIGAGNISPGIVSETTGAALTIQATVLGPHVDPHKSIPVYMHSYPNRYLFVPVCPTGGMTYKWFKDTFGECEVQQAIKDNLDPYEALNRIASEAPAGCDGLVMLPHLMGAYSPEPNSFARGSFTGFTLSHKKGHFVRAILEGVAFLLKQNLEVVQRAGVEIHEVRSTGGGARSLLWNQIKSNVCNLPVVTLKNEETALLGNAILAGVASGIFSSIEQGCATMVNVKDRIFPNHEAVLYEKPYQIYCELDRVLNQFFTKSYKND